MVLGRSRVKITAAARETAKVSSRQGREVGVEMDIGYL